MDHFLKKLDIAPVQKVVGSVLVEHFGCVELGQHCHLVAVFQVNPLDSVVNFFVAIEGPVAALQRDYSRLASCQPQMLRTDQTIVGCQF